MADSKMVPREPTPGMARAAIEVWRAYASDKTFGAKPPAAYDFWKAMYDAAPAAAAANPAVILALLDEIAALRADAERFQWLCNTFPRLLYTEACGETAEPHDWIMPSKARAAIDRARGRTT